MDPISIIIVLLAAWGIVQRLPNLARQVGSDTWSALNGDGTPIRDKVRGDLIAEGIAPTGGGKARSFLGDLFKGLLHDFAGGLRDPAAGGKGTGWLGGAGVKAGRRLRERLGPYAGGPGGNEPRGPGPGSGGATPGDPADPKPGAGGGTHRGPQPGPAGDPPPPIYVGDITPPRTSIPPGSGPAADGPHPTPDNTQSGVIGGDQRTPIHVGDITPTSTTTPAGTPAVTGTATAVLEGPKPMSDLATRGGEVTGVVSGAAEARAIEAQIRAITESFVADLTRIQMRLYALGDATLSIVQFAGTSDVVAACAGAAEALASAKGAANNVTGEVSPALLQVAKQFDARNS